MWANPNPNSDFASQSITIDGLTNYEAIAIYYRNTASSTAVNQFATYYATVADLLQTTYNGNEVGMGGGTSGCGASRAVKMPSETTIEFANTKQLQQYANNLCVPLKIYGIKKALFANVP